MPFLLLNLALFAAPIARTLALSVLEPSIGIGNFVLALNDPLFQQVLWTTLRISVEVTVLSIVLAYPVASFAVDCSKLTRNVVFALVLVPFWTSLLVRVYGWTFILQRTGPINEMLLWLGMIHQPLKLIYTEAAVVIGITHYMLPFMIFALFTSLSAVDRRLKPAAAALGAKPLRVFLTVTLPLIAPGMIGGSVLVFIGTIGFFVTPAMLGGPAQMMIANLITFEVKESLNWPMAATMSALLMAIVAVLSWVYFRFLDRSGIQAGAT
jgi:ABC-type spermidine/putrescine transport system permease subunit I